MHSVLIEFLLTVTDHRPLLGAKIVVTSRPLRPSQPELSVVRQFLTPSQQLCPIAVFYASSKAILHFVVGPTGSMSLVRPKENIKEKGFKECDVLSRDLNPLKVGRL